MKALWFLPLILATTAGCLGGDGGSTDTEPIDDGPAEDVPQLQGWVFDPALRPLADASVTVLETGDVANTNRDGHYGFDDLPTDEPIVVVTQMDGFISQSKRITLGATQNLRINFTLEPEPVLQAYSEVLDHTGFINCQIVVETEDSADTHDCSGGAADDDVWEFPVQKDLAGLVLEMFWEEGQKGAEFMRARLETVGFGDSDTVLGEAEGLSPVKIRVGSGLAGQYYQEGGMMRVVVEPSANLEEQEMGAGTAIAVQQDFEVFASAFYVDPAPTDYSVEG